MSNEQRTDWWNSPEYIALSSAERRKYCERHGFVIGVKIPDCERAILNQRLQEDVAKAQLSKKELRQIEKGLNEKPKSAILQSIAKGISSLIDKIVPLVGMVGIPLIIYWGVKIYKIVAASEWQQIFHTRYSLFIVSYVAVYFILERISYTLYRYGNDL